MAEYSRNPERDAHSDCEDQEVDASSGGGLMYRRSEPAGGAVVASNLPLQAHFARPSAGLGSIPMDAPGFDSETSGESVGLWAGAYSSEATRLAPSMKAPMAYDHVPAHRDAPLIHMNQSKGNMGGGFAAPPGSFNPFASDQYRFAGYESPPRYFAPFGSAGMATKSGLSSYGGELEDLEAPCVATLPSTFRLERTNLVVTPPPTEQSLSVDSLLDALRASLFEAGVDVLDLKPAHCVLECSYHVGNRFLSLFVRVFKAPNRASGQLFDNSSMGINNDDDEPTPFLVEAQLREGDRLHFSALFREIMRAFMNQEGVNLAGTFRYKPRAYPASGEGLALEQVNMAPSRNSIRLLAERGEAIKAGGSPLPVPASMARPQASSSAAAELDSDMIDDVVLLADMLSGSYLDVQADAAAAVAGLTTDGE
ncbi:unnamed protein product, partial [Ectocarpus fasciculatus]